MSTVGGDQPAERGHGWMLLAAVLLLLNGTMGLITGLTALLHSEFFVVGARFVFSDLRTWGWIVTIVGALTLLAGLTLRSGSAFARWFGIGIIALQALAQMMMIQSYPYWALAIFSVDILGLYALIVYADRGQS
jgi:hypothetical protein